MLFHCQWLMMPTTDWICWTTEHVSRLPNDGHPRVYVLSGHMSRWFFSRILSELSVSVCPSCLGRAHRDL